MNWRREVAWRDSQALASTRDTEYWHQAVRELRFTSAEMEDTNNVRLVAARAQQLKDNAGGHRG